jgi:hypothetical protein
MRRGEVGELWLLCVLARLLAVRFEEDQVLHLSVRRRWQLRVLLSLPCVSWLEHSSFNRALSTCAYGADRVPADEAE